MEERKFKNAPVSELVCGVRIPKGILNISLIGDIYKHFKNDFPLMEEALPFANDLLPTVLYGKGSSNNNDNKPTFVRYWFLDKNKNKLIQLQDGAIYCNWRKLPGDEINYPKFKSVFTDFIRVFEYIQGLIGKRIEITGAELTYLNHIYPDKIGLKVGRIDHMITQTKLTGIFENTNAYKMRLNLPISTLNGVYFIDLTTSKLVSNSENVIVWNHGIKAVDFGDDFEVNAWFEEAHKFINERFMEIITEEFKKSMGYHE